MSMFIIPTLHKILFQESNKWYVGYVACMGKLIMHSFARETITERPFGRPRHRRVDNIETDLQETEWQTWIGLIWLRIGTCGRVLQTWCTFRFDKMWKVCQLAKSCSCVHTSTQHSPCFSPYCKILLQVSVLQFWNSDWQELQNLQ